MDNRIDRHDRRAAEPGDLHDTDGEKTYSIDLAELCKALGVQHVRKVDPYDIDETFAAIKEEINRDAASVIITTRPCMLFPKKVTGSPYEVDLEKCIACGACLTSAALRYRFPK